MAKSQSAKGRPDSFGRRGFLKGAAAGAAAVVTNPHIGKSQEAAGPRGSAPGGRGPGAAQLARDAGAPAENARVIENPGSDFMVDVIKSLGIEYLAANPGSTFEWLHESRINYGHNTMPEFLTCCHEESAVGMAQGYAKIEGKPMMALIHGTVGLQHAAMAIYNAFADRAPVYLVVGNHADSAARSGIESYHSAQDIAALVRDFTKWDDEPVSLEGFADSAVRAYQFATTPPMGPVLLVANHELQSSPAPPREPRIPRL